MPDKKFSKSNTYYDCGICGHWHPVEWDGDCREDAARFTTSELEDGLGKIDVDWFEAVMDEDGFFDYVA